VTDLAPGQTEARHSAVTCTYWGLGLFLLSLAIYGSLVPFHYRSSPRDAALARQWNIAWLLIGVEGRSDFVPNVLLFIPPGYLSVAVPGVDWHPMFLIPAALPIVPLLCGLAVGIELARIWFERQTVSLNDTIVESVGAVIGAAARAITGKTIPATARAAWSVQGRRELAARLLAAYLAFLVLIHVMPLDLTKSPVEVWHKYNAGPIVFVAFTAPLAGIEQLGLPAPNAIATEVLIETSTAGLGCLLTRPPLTAMNTRHPGGELRAYLPA
jgi:hypothetical protein